MLIYGTIIVISFCPHAVGSDAQAVNSNGILISSFQPQNVTNGTVVCPEYIRNSSFPLYVPENEVFFQILTDPINVTVTRNQTTTNTTNGNYNLSMCFIVEVNTSVICFLSNSSGNALVNLKVEIYVQGLLLEVTNLSSHVNCNSTTLFITWTPPLTLERVPILFFIDISRLDGGASVNSNTINMTKYCYNAMNQFGETLVIAVTPMNDAGPGDSTNITVSGKYILCTYR